MICDPFFLNSKFHSFMAFKPGGGEKSSERKAAFSPPPGPPPLFWPRLSCKKMPAAFSTNWAVSPTREYELGEKFLLAKKKLRPTHNFSSTTHPNTNRSPPGLRTYKKRLWVDGDGAPGTGQRANRNALAPSPGLKAVREWYFKRIRKHHEVLFGPRSEGIDQKGV